MIKSPYGNVIEVLDAYAGDKGVTLLLKHEDGQVCEYPICELVADGGSKEISKAISSLPEQ